MLDKKDYQSIFAHNLKKLMIKRDVSFRQIEKDTGISHSTVHNYTQRTRMPPIDKAKKLANYFGKTLEEMIDNEL